MGQRILPNADCPCGSGRKFKKCHGDATYTLDKGVLLPDSAVSAIRTRKNNERVEKFGLGKPVIHAMANGHRAVAVGNKIGIGKWPKFPYFLRDYAKQILGREFWQADAQESPDTQHPILQWWNEIFGSTSYPAGAFSSFLILANDLYTLDHHRSLQETLVRRLKNKKQFQGARYELSVAATFIRAGFELRHEDESNGRTKHPEFVGTCKYTGAIIAAEAKSRQRNGVLGFPGEKLPPEKVRLDIGNLINEALKKAPQHPYVIFIDVNMPVNGEALFNSAWSRKLKGTFDRVIGSDRTNDKFSAIFFTNFANHYASPGEPLQKGEWYMLKGGALQDRDPILPVLMRLTDALRKYDHVPLEFSESD